MPNASGQNRSPWLIGACVALAAFMEIMDTSIANVALPYMAGNLAVTNDESTWILTSYLVSNAIVLPISGWLANLFGRKRFFMGCLVIFVVSSICCGLAPNLPVLLLCRIIQGIGGGGLQPMAQAIMADSFPPEKRGQAFALYGFTAVLAPAIGPTLGGWLTYAYSWRWIFFINLPMGLLTLFLVWTFVDDNSGQKRDEVAAHSFDYVGIAFLVLGIGALQIMLDRGQQDDWFGSHVILLLAIIAGVSLVALVIWEWFHENPIVDVKLFKNFNFATSCLMMFLFGVILFGGIVMMPQFLQTLMGYTAELAGLVLSAAGVILFLEMPIVGKLTTVFQARYMIAFGWLSLAFGMYYSAQRIDLLISFGVAQWIRVIQAYGMAFLFVPITLVSYIGLAKEKGNSASGLLNFMRNMGSSVGTSVVTTLVARRAQLHQDYLSSHTTTADPLFEQAVESSKQLFLHQNASSAGAMGALAKAQESFYHIVRDQATTLAYIDTYALLAIAAGIMFFTSFLLRKNEPGKGAGGGEAG